MDWILSAEKINAGYKNRKVLHNVSLYANEGDKILLIGPNGCGKSTLLKVLAGTLRPHAGEVTFKGQSIITAPTHHRVHLGMAYLKQTRNIFPSLTVLENMQLGFWGEKGDINNRCSWLVSIFPMLKDKLEKRAGLLSGGERQALAISMVLMRPVEFLLLDEPTAGLAPKSATAVLESLDTAQRALNFTSIMVEHNTSLVYHRVSRALIMRQGRIIAEELDPSELQSQENLQRYYFE